MEDDYILAKIAEIQHRRKISAHEIAHEINVTVDDARHLLNDLVRRGKLEAVSELEWQPSGTSLGYRPPRAKDK